MTDNAPKPRTALVDRPWGPSVIVAGFLIFANLVCPLLAELVSGGLR